MEQTKFILSEKEIPTSWYNVQADLPEPLPPILHPGTKEPTILPPPLFPAAINDQEFSKERYIEIPEEVQEIYRLWRPTPLHRALRLEKALDTPAKIFYKYEGVSPAGSHKLNTAVAQAYYNKKAGIKRLATETGAGQWGSALSMGCNFMGLECKVYMVKVSYNQKPYRRILMEVFGAKVVPSPSQETQVGRKILTEDPNSPGSLGIAISEACEDAFTRDDTIYSLGSVLNHVLLHQTVIGLEASKQLEMAGMLSRHHHRLRRRRQQLRRACPALRPGQAQGQEDTDHRRRAGSLPQHHQGALRLGLRRRGRHGADRQDVHPGPQLRAAAGPRRRPALPRHGAHRVALPEAGHNRDQGRGPDWPSSRPRCSSPGPRASSPRPSRLTPSRWSSTRR